jgi:hypothetical protein
MDIRHHRGDWGPRTWEFSGDPEWVDHTVKLIMTGCFESRYHWHVAFGSDDHKLRVVVPTNPTGALKLFKDRELTSGKTRREALRHWVEHHYRDDEEAGTIYIRDHLRGHTDFGWNKMPCELMVSAYDLEKNDAFKNEAALWRATRKHNSVRVRLKRPRT